MKRKLVNSLPASPEAEQQNTSPDGLDREDKISVLAATELLDSGEQCSVSGGGASHHDRQQLSAPIERKAARKPYSWICYRKLDFPSPQIKEFKYQ